MFLALNNWITELPTTLAVGAVVGILAALSVLGLALFHLVVPHSIRRAHNEVIGFILAVIGVIYAVLLAFIAVAVWEDFGTADALVQTEANLVGNLYRDTVGLPNPLATGLRHNLFVYAETVVQDEWPALAAGLLLRQHYRMENLEGRLLEFESAPWARVSRRIYRSWKKLRRAVDSNASKFRLVLNPKKDR